MDPMGNYYKFATATLAAAPLSQLASSPTNKEMVFTNHKHIPPTKPIINMNKNTLHPSKNYWLVQLEQGSLSCIICPTHPNPNNALLFWGIPSKLTYTSYVYIYINLHCYPSKIGNLMTPVKNILRLVVSITIHTITWTPWKWRFFKT